MSEQKYFYLSKAADDLAKCTKCASCQAGCPTFELSASETLVARGKIRLAQAVLNGNLDITDRVKKDFDTCLSCMSCRTACPSGVDTMAVFSAMKEEINHRDGSGAIASFIFKYILPYPWRLNLLAKIVGFSTIFYKMAPSFLSRLLPYSDGGIKRVTPDFLKINLRSKLSRVSKASGSVPERPGRVKKVVFYSGCMTDLAFPETGKTVVEELTKRGVEVIFPKEQVCCGAPAYFNGDIETAKGLARTNIKVLSEIDADAIVYSCATCGSVLGETYPELFPDDEQVKKLAEKTVDFQKLLIELSAEKLLAGVTDGRKLKVTYHDPCHLKRGMGVSAEPRQLIKSLPSVEFVEMEGADSCCGGSGTFAIKHYDMGMEQGARKANWINDSKADVVVTACPSCQLQLADSLHRNGFDIPVMHTADLIGYAESFAEKNGLNKD